MPKIVSRRLALISATLASVTLASVTLAACALAEPYDPAHLTAPARDRVGAICRTVIGLQRGEAQFGACVDSLSATAAGLAEGVALAQARDACRDTGARPGAVALAECELRGARSASTQPAVEPESGLGSGLGSEPASGPEPASTPARSYFLTANSQIVQRERLACARLGVEPAGPDFGRCVADLAVALFAADNPAH